MNVFLKHVYLIKYLCVHLCDKEVELEVVVRFRDFYIKLYFDEYGFTQLLASLR